MDFGILFRRAGQVAAKKSPAILTAIGVTGALTTAYLAAKGGFKAKEVLDDHIAEKKDEAGYDDEGICKEQIFLSTREIAEVTWKCYIPAASVAAITVISIVCANRVSERRAAAIASMYAVVRESYADYRKKNIEKLGVKKEQALRDEVAEEFARKHPISQSKMTMISGMEVLVLDRWSGRYFTSDMETIRSAVNQFNADVVNETYRPLSSYYEMVGLSGTQGSDLVGWNTDELMDMGYTWVEEGDGNRILITEFLTLPHDRYSSSF